MKVLVVGGAGYVGTILRPALEAVHQCTYFDRLAIPGCEERTLIGDVLHDRQVARAVVGAEAVVYLAMGSKHGTVFSPKGPHDNVNSVGPAFSVNVGGWFNFLSAGLKAGARRFVYASTMSVYHRLEDLYHVDDDLPTDGWGGYAMSKRAGEFLCQAAAQRCPEAVVISLRLNAPRNEADFAEVVSEFGTGRDMLGPEDARSLFLAALACDRPGAHMIQASSDTTGKRYPCRRAAELLGWKAKGK